MALRTRAFEIMVDAVRKRSKKAGNQFDFADVDDDIDPKVREMACALCEDAAALNDGHDRFSRGRNLVEMALFMGKERDKDKKKSWKNIKKEVDSLFPEQWPASLELIKYFVDHKPLRNIDTEKIHSRIGGLRDLEERLRTKAEYYFAQLVNDMRQRLEGESS